MTARSRRVRHPLFARIFNRVSRQLEERGQAEHRRRLLEGLSGRVIEVGAGNGINFPYYPDSVTGLVAVEPETYLRRRAEEAARTSKVAVTVVDGLADALPGDTALFDAGVASLVLCSVPDQGAALAELRRVIRPGGELRFYEHVRSPRPRLARAQLRLDRVWPHVNGGCHASRDTRASIEGAGFEIEACEEFEFLPFPLALPTSPHILGIARRCAD